MPQGVLGGINASLSFTTGSPAVTSWLYTTTGRFKKWLPDFEDIGPSEVALATGGTFKWIERSDYTVSLDIDHVPAISLPAMQLFKQWLEQGNTITVNTNDAFANSYSCMLKPKGKVSISGPDKLLEYTFSVQLKNTAGAPLQCVYTPLVGTGYTLTVSPNPIVGIAGGGPGLLSVVLKDPSGNVVSGLPVYFYSNNPAVVTVSPAGNLQLLTAGSANIFVQSGGIVAKVPATVTAGSVTVSSIVLSPAPSFAFTATTYTGTPVVNITGVPPQLVTATLKNSSGIVIPYTAGALTWSISNGTFFIRDNNDGTCTVWAVFGSGSATLTCTSTAVGTVHQTISLTCAASTPAALVPTTSTVNFTAPGQNISDTVVTIDQYGTVVP